MNIAQPTKQQVLDSLSKARDGVYSMERTMGFIENDLNFAARHYPDISFAEQHLRRLHENATRYAQMVGEVLAKVEAERQEVAA